MTPVRTPSSLWLILVLASGCGPKVGAADGSGDGSGDASGSGSSLGDDATAAGCADPPCFEATDPVAAGPGARELVIVDCDRDGHLDLLVANSDAATVSVARGHGDGSFEFQQTWAAGEDPWSIAPADFDGDGNLDLAVGNFINGANVLPGAAGCTFGAPVALFAEDPLGPYTTGAIAVAAGDLDGDGHDDVVAEMSGDIDVGYFAIFRGAGDGTFAPFETVASGTVMGHVGIVDLDRDGVQDLVGTTSWLSGSTGAAAYFAVVRGSGGGTFAELQELGTVAEPEAFAAADLDGDGVLNLVAAGGLSFDTSYLSMVRGLGNATFSAQVTFPLGTGDATGTAAGDLDGDGDIDVVVGLGFENQAALLLGGGDGSFGTPRLLTTGANPTANDGWEPFDLELADLDEDGRLDLAASNFAGNVSVLLQTD